MSKAAIEVPAGFRQNGKGHLVPEHMISEVEKLIDDQVKEIAAEWKELAARIAEFKTSTFGDIHAILGTINEQYSVKRGGEKGNVQLLSYDGKYKLLIAVNDVIELGPEVQACIEKLKECTSEWSEGAKPELKAVVEELLATNGKGTYSISKLLQIRRLKVPGNADWALAMQALDAALRPINTKQYLRLCELQPNGSYTALPLDIAAL